MVQSAVEAARGYLLDAEKELTRMRELGIAEPPGTRGILAQARKQAEVADAAADAAERQSDEIMVETYRLMSRQVNPPATARPPATPTAPRTCTYNSSGTFAAPYLSSHEAVGGG